MKRFVVCCLLFLSPYVILLGGYLYYDPFKVLCHYDNYYVEGDGGSVNRNYVSTMNYLNKRKRYHYDSFIFGNSRSIFYRVADWKKHLHEKCICYHFSESNGSINGIYYKLELLDSLHIKINNALLVVDVSLLQTIEQTHGANFMTPPVLTNNRNFLQFQAEHFFQWADFRFLTLWSMYHLTGIYKPFMSAFLAKNCNYKYYDPITNEERMGMEDSLIAIGKYYDAEHIKVFKRTPKLSDISLPTLDNVKIGQLKKMRAIFDKHHTEYRIVISPLYNQVKLNPSDLECLDRIFGKMNVYDFSGKNKWTNDYHNYYEPSHYLPRVAAEIMDSIYCSY